MPRFDIRRLKDDLDYHIRQLTELQSQIDEHGDKPLDSRQKTLLREAIASGTIRNLQNEARYFFTDGNFKDFEQNITYMLEIAEFLC